MPEFDKRNPSRIDLVRFLREAIQEAADNGDHPDDQHVTFLLPELRQMLTAAERTS